MWLYTFSKHFICFDFSQSVFEYELFCRDIKSTNCFEINTLFCIVIVNLRNRGYSSADTWSKILTQQLFICCSGGFPHFGNRQFTIIDWSIPRVPVLSDTLDESKIFKNISHSSVQFSIHFHPRFYVRHYE